jgi:hypothetical protein
MERIQNCYGHTFREPLFAIFEPSSKETCAENLSAQVKSAEIGQHNRKKTGRKLTNTTDKG